MSEIAWGYARVSSDRQANEGVGIQMWCDKIVRYAEQHDLDLGNLRTQHVAGITLEIPERLGIESESAYKTNFRDRRVGGHLWDYAAPDDHVIIAGVDRGFRSQRDCLNTVLDWINERLVRVHILDMAGHDLDLVSPMGQMLLSILSAMGEWESKIRAERTKRAFAQAKLQNRRCHDFAPIGFRFRGEGKHRRLVLCPEEMAIIKQVCRWKEEEGLSEVKLYKRLNDNGIVPPEPENMGEWSRGDASKYTYHRIKQMLRIGPRLVKLEEAHGDINKEAVAELEEFTLRLHETAEQVAKHRSEKAKRERRRAEIRKLQQQGLPSHKPKAS